MFIGDRRVFDEVFTETTISANAKTVSIIGITSLDELVDKVMYLKAGSANTGAVTLNVNGYGATDLMKYSKAGLVALEANNIIEGQICVLTYDGTQFILLNSVEN